jgi:hypothetical protein
VRHFCTYFDRNYLVQGLTLYRSLERHSAPFTLWVLCLDDSAYDTLQKMGLGNVRLTRLRELEAADPGLAAAKTNRSVIEYYFTLSPVWPRYLLTQFPEIDQITYLDSDLQFYSDPEPIFEEMGSASVLIAEHRFPDHLKELEKHGVYNVGLLSFRNDEKALECLERWRLQCLKWCYDRLEDGKFADQKYLDAWPQTLRGVHVLQHKGAGLAPWNWMLYDLSFDGEKGTVDGHPLIFFHFQGFKILNRWLFRPTIESYDPMPRQLRRRLYGGYLRELGRTGRWVRSLVPDGDIGSTGHARDTTDFRHLIRTLGYRATATRLLEGQLSLRPRFLIS